MNDEQFAEYLRLLMCADPWPECIDHELISEGANVESVKRGYIDWIDAYHKTGK